MVVFLRLHWFGRGFSRVSMFLVYPLRFLLLLKVNHGGFGVLEPF